MTGFEIGMLGLTAVYVGTTIFYAVTSKNTLSEIEKERESSERQFNSQILEMQKAREQTVAEMQSASAQAARQVGVMQQQVEQMKSAGEQTKELITQATDQVTQLKTLADATSRTAVSALAQAVAVINAERPWMFIEITTRAFREIPGEPPESIAFTVKFRNHGKTPAEIVNFDQHPDCRNSTDDLPVPPVYSMEGHVMVHTRMVPPGGEFVPPGEPVFMPDKFFVAEQWKDIRSSRRRLIYWGRLQYRDLIEDARTIHELDKVKVIHETCFCYFWSPRLNEFLITGPLGYNKHT